MSNLLVLIALVSFVSCTSLGGQRKSDTNSPGYQQSRQMDEKSLEGGFLERL